MMLTNRAVTIRQQGDLARASGIFDELLTMSLKSGNRLDAALALHSIAEIALERGDLARARAKFEEALAINQQIGSPREVAGNLYGVARVLLAQGDLAGARKREEECLAIVQRIGEYLEVPEVRLVLAWLSIEEGDPGQAERTALDIVRDFEKQNDINSGALARSALAQSLLAQGRVAEAREAVDRAAALSGKSEAPRVRLLVAMTVARVRAAAGGAGAAARALKNLEAARAEARKAGRVGLEFEARLAIGEIELQSGRSAAGRQRLEELEREARSRGFGLVARKAAAAAEHGPPHR
jgi:ATP/maltotriose-dependent transcriptional regulator MalT